MKTLKTFFSSFRNAVISIVCAVAVLAAIGTGAALAAGAGKSGDVMDRNAAFDYALADAGLSAQEVTITKQKLDKDDKGRHYDIEFFSETYSYSYEIDAFTGAVLDVSIEALFDKPSAASGIAAAQGGQESGQSGQKEQNPQESGQSGQEGQNPQGAVQSGQEGQNPQGAVQSGQEGQNPQGAGQSGQEGQNPQESGQPGQGQGSQQGLLDLETAKAAALADAGVDAADAVFTESKLDWDDGVQVYDIEFRTLSAKYDYEINAATGAILSKDAKGVWNDQGGPADLEGAKAAALADAGVDAADAVFTKSKLDWDDGVQVYEIKFYTSDAEYDYEISADNGGILDKSMELLENRIPSGESGGNAGAYIGVDQAKSAAVTHAGFGVEDVIFTKTKLEREHGYVKYEVEFYKDRMEYEYSIDAYTGSILEYESEYDD